MRESHVESRMVERADIIETVHCDKCEKLISPEGDDYHAVSEADPWYANELIIYLNPDECASQRFRRDYCTDCLKPIWDKLCELIGADPDDISGKDFE